MSETSNIIEIRELTKNYGDRRAIDRLSFNVKKGEVVGFLGPNGAGKTTTMKIITGFIAPTAGEVRIAGYDVFENPYEVKRRIGYLPETPPIYGDMIVADYLDFVARLKGVESSRVPGLVARALEKTQLTDVRKRLIQNLSKGYRQRVGLAQAIVSDPEILILDEPTVGLDPRQVAEIRNLLQELRGSHTIVLSTHILSEVQATCDRVIIINSGRIVAEDTLSGLSHRLRGNSQLHIRVRRNASDLAQALERVPGITEVKMSGVQIRVQGNLNDDLIEKIAEAAVQQRSGLIELTQPDAGLENIFIELTSQQQQ